MVEFELRSIDNINRDSMIILESLITSSKKSSTSYLYPFCFKLSKAIYQHSHMIQAKYHTTRALRAFILPLKKIPNKTQISVFLFQNAP